MKNSLCYNVLPGDSSICKSLTRDYNSLQNLPIEDKPTRDTQLSIDDNILEKVYAIDNGSDTRHAVVNDSTQAPCFLCLPLVVYLGCLVFLLYQKTINN